MIFRRNLNHSSIYAFSHRGRKTKKIKKANSATRKKSTLKRCDVINAEYAEARSTQRKTFFNGFSLRPLRLCVLCVNNTVDQNNGHFSRYHRTLRKTHTAYLNLKCKLSQFSCCYLTILECARYKWHFSFIAQRINRLQASRPIGWIIT